MHPESDSIESPDSGEPDDFDSYAADYDAALDRGIGVSGEDKTYFARGRIAWLAKCLDHLQVRPRMVLDFGCGTGSSPRFLLDLARVESMLGADRSIECLRVARDREADHRARFI